MGDKIIFNAKPGDQINERTYWHFLEVLPPAFMNGSLFQLGEPFDHNNQGLPRYGTYVKLDSGYYYLGLHTTKEAKNRDKMKSIIK